MKNILLDTSFILSAIKNKIDIFEELIGYNILIPKQIISELEGLAKNNPTAKLAMKIINNKSKINYIQLPGKNTDNAIINYAKENPDILVASLDREIKNKIKNMKLIIKGKKKLEII